MDIVDTLNELSNKFLFLLGLTVSPNSTKNNLSAQGNMNVSTRETRSLTWEEVVYQHAADPELAEAICACSSPVEHLDLVASRRSRFIQTMQAAGDNTAELEEMIKTFESCNKTSGSEVNEVQD